MKIGWRRPCAALILALSTSACAMFGPDRPQMSWAQFLAGEDLTGVCMPGSPEFIRIVFYDREPARLRLFEISERPEGGAVIAARTLNAADMAQVAVTDTFGTWRGTNTDLILAPLAFAQLVRRLDDLGAFDMPMFGPHRRPQHVRWLITGCHGGEWFFNAFAVTTELGLPTRLR